MTQTASRRSNFKQSDVTRAIRAAEKAGMTLSGCKVEPSGAIIMKFHDGASINATVGNPWDDELLS